MKYAGIEIPQEVIEHLAIGRLQWMIDRYYGSEEVQKKVKEMKEMVRLARYNKETGDTGRVKKCKEKAKEIQKEIEEGEKKYIEELVKRLSE